MATITLSRAELEQIRASILPSVENKSFLDRKAELKKKSEDKLKNWPNTLEAIRLKKENDFLDRERQVELQRQEVDKQVKIIKLYLLIIYFFFYHGFSWINRKQNFVVKCG